MARALWSGAISFGLVYIPVQMHSASHANQIDLDMLDKHDFSPVGYQRINKRTGKVVDWGDIVKGYQYRKGEYVALSDEDFRQANVKASQTIEIQNFVDVGDISPMFYETPYYLAPAKGGAKVYALLREALSRTQKAAIATFVMRSKQHIAVVLPNDRALVLNTLRFADEIREPKDLDLPAASKAVGLTAAELSMAERLVNEMTGSWNPRQYSDTYRDDLMKRIHEKVRKKQMHQLTQPDKSSRKTGQGAEIIDLMAALKRSLKESGGGDTSTRKPAKRADGNGAGTKRSAGRVRGKKAARSARSSSSRARHRAA
jgi:DNA end-binding protein Ku